MLRTKSAKKKKKFDGEFDITPMIDVVLLLLIFFMVSARMAPSSNAKLPKARYGDMSAMHDAVVLIVKSVSPGVSSVSNLTGRKFSSDPDEQSAEIEEFVTQAMEDTTKKVVLIQGEGTVKTSDMVRVQLAAGKALGPDQEVLIAVEN